MVIITSGKGGGAEGQSLVISELDDSKVSHVLTMAPLSAYIMNRKLQPNTHSSSQ